MNVPEVKLACVEVGADKRKTSKQGMFEVAKGSDEVLMAEKALYGQRIHYLEEKVKQLQAELDAVPVRAIKTRLQFKTPMAWMTNEMAGEYAKANSDISWWLIMRDDSGDEFDQEAQVPEIGVENPEEKA